MLCFPGRALCSALLACALSLAAAASWAQAPTQSVASEQNVVGPSQCAKCHKVEATIWQHTHHFASFRSMPRLPKAEEIAQKMGIQRIREAGTICAKCHFTSAVQNGQLQVIAGISCESCHGPGKNYIDVHPGKKGETPAQIAERLRRAQAAGMIRPNMIFKIAKNCYSCHIVPQEKLVNIGGHVAGSPFEMVSWTQGEIRHNTWYSDGKSNNPAPINIQRKMYVIGAAVELSESLRAVGNATQNASYAVTMARRAQAAAQRLQTINNALQLPETKEMMAAVATARLNLNNGPQLDGVADKIDAAAQAFDHKYDGSQLGAIDSMIPGPQYYKGQPFPVNGQ
ncbi:MAG TPA: multiheme c-type cytochrome [Stellaceae bacterium]|nr:multiheme c-type cytochrome [Stellaceae bacterium]